MFRRLGVFVGGCAPEAIETVCNVESVSHVLDTAESLVGKSLLKETEADGEPRFAMLETIREYAGEKLVAAGEEQRVRTTRLKFQFQLHALILAEGAKCCSRDDAAPLRIRAPGVTLAAPA